MHSKFVGQFRYIRLVFDHPEKDTGEERGVVKRVVMVLMIHMGTSVINMVMVVVVVVVVMVVVIVVVLLLERRIQIHQSDIQVGNNQKKINNV